MPSSRRTFLKAASALTATAARSLHAFAGIENSPAPALNQFGFGDVELLEGPLRQQFQTNHNFYSKLNEDSLLKPFRQRAGIDAPGDEMGGWYSWAPLGDLDKAGDNGFAPCHSFGQYLSGLSRDYAATGSKATQEKVHRLVRNFAPAISSHFWDGNRFPAYTYDKISIGLLDAHQLACAPDALKILNKAFDSVSSYLPPGGISRDAQRDRPHKDESFCWDEPYTMAENFFIAYERGAGNRYRDLAIRFLPDDWYFNPLAAGENVLPGKHAYSHANAMSSAAKAYLALGSEKHLRAAKAGFDFIREQSFATGGWGPDESFRKPGSGEVGDSLTKTHSSFETPCGSYAHFKLTRYLLRATKDSRYGDSMEQVLYNGVLGAKPINEDGHGFYYSDYNKDGSKFYHPYKWHCCTGSFAQITADYGISAYFNDGQGIYVNLYVPSNVKWGDGNRRIAIKQVTNYPHHPTTTLIVSADKSSAFPIYLRIPAWAGLGTSVSVNGKREASSPTPGQFAVVKREWKNGDRIEVEFDMPSALQAVDQQHPSMMALTHGPLALFAVGAVPDRVSRQQLLGAAQVASGSTEWQSRTEQGSLKLLPFTSIQGEHYRLYQQVES